MIERELKTYNQIIRAKIAYQLAENYDISNDQLNEIYDFIQDPGARITSKNPDLLLFYKNDQLEKTITAKYKKAVEASMIYSNGHLTIIPAGGAQGGYGGYNSWDGTDLSSGGSSFDGGSSNNNNG